MMVGKIQSMLLKWDSLFITGHMFQTLRKFMNFWALEIYLIILK